jgi:hypothetical protein
MMKLTYRAVAAIFALLAVTSASAQAIHVTVDGHPVVFPDVQPSMMRGRVMVPIRGVFEFMHATVDWDGENKQVVAHHDFDELSLPVDSQIALFNGEQRHVDVPVIFTHGRVLVPLRFMSETLRSSVEWDAATQTVVIGTNGSMLLAPGDGEFKSRTMNAGTVLDMHLTELLRSNVTPVGTKFRAIVDSTDDNDEASLPAGTTVDGHVDFVQAAEGDSPGVIGLAIDDIRMPEGKRYSLPGFLIPEGFQANGTRLHEKFVGFGEGGEMYDLVSSRRTLSARELRAAAKRRHGAAIPEAHDVILEPGVKFRVLVTRGFKFRVRAKD